MLEERYLYLNEEEDIRMEDSREENWRDVDDYGKDKNNFHSLRLEVYTRDKEELIKREFLIYVTYPKVGNIF